MWVSLKIWVHKNRKWWLTKKGVEKYNRETGSNLKTGVKWKPNSVSDMQRKWSFLTRFYTNPSGPMKKPNWEPTRLALAANAWGETPPKNNNDAKKLAAKWRSLLDRAKKKKSKM